MHTLVLLDIKVKEQSEENLARQVLNSNGLSMLICFRRGRKIYEPPRYMSIPVAVNQLLETEGTREEGILKAEETLAVALSRVGGGDEQRIVAGTLKELQEADPSVFGDPLHSLILIGKRVHHLEVDYAATWTINPENWREIARRVYGCNMD